MAPAPDAKVSAPLVRAVVDAKTPADRLAAVGAIEKLGLPALPAVLKAADPLAADYLGRAALRDLAARLALVVAETRFGDDSAKPTDAVCRRVESLRDQPVTPDGVPRPAPGLVRRPARGGAGGVRLTLERVGDDTGVLLLVTLARDRPACRAGPAALVRRPGGHRGQEPRGWSQRVGRAGRAEAEPRPGIDWTEFADHLRYAR